jgi:hypothetical protein
LQQRFAIDGTKVEVILKLLATCATPFHSKLLSLDGRCWGELLLSTTCIEAGGSAQLKRPVCQADGSDVCLEKRGD